MRQLCLDHLTLSDLTALELIDIAAQLEFTGVSVFVTPLPLGPYRDLINDLKARAEIVAALRANNLDVGIIEPFMLDAQPDWSMLERTVELTAELGGRVNMLGFDEEPTRLHDSVCQLSELADRYNVQACIEAFPLSAVRTIGQALALAQAAGTHVGLCIDSLHVIRSGGSWDDVAALPPERIFHVQVNDGPLQPPQDRYLEATLERLPPGSGEFGLKRFLPLIPATAVMAVEAPFKAPEGMSPLERARIARDGLLQLM